MFKPISICFRQKAFEPFYTGEPVETGLQEGTNEHHTGFVLRNAAGAHIEERIFVQVAACRAVAAFHVVSENLKLRLRVELGFIRENEPSDQLMPFGLLRVFVDLGSALHNGTGPPRGHSPDILRTLTMGRLMAYTDGCIAVARLVQQQSRPDMGMRTGLGQCNVAFDPHQGPAENTGLRRIRRIAPDTHTSGR